MVKRVKFPGNFFREEDNYEVLTGDINTARRALAKANEEAEQGLPIDYSDEINTLLMELWAAGYRKGLSDLKNQTERAG